MTRFALQLLGALATLLAFSTTTPAHAATDGCTALAGAPVIGIIDAPTVIEGAVTVAKTPDLPGHCRVSGYVTPGVGFELRMPAEGWNGKLMVQGCGGFCGMIFIDILNDALRRGYAVMTSDLGHRARSLDAAWAYNNRQAEIDFGYRGTYVTTVAAKHLVDIFYGRPASRSYFRGCSVGGRQGLMAAQRYPDLFDGIVAGAPGFSETGRALRMMWSARATVDANGKSVIDGTKMTLLTAAAVKACDMDDGLADGIIGRPLACRFDPATLACRDGGGTDCLTPPEVAAVRKIYGGPVDSKGRQLLPGGWFPGSERDWINYVTDYSFTNSTGVRLTGAYAKVATDYMRYLAFHDDPGPSYNFLDFDFDRDPARMGSMAAILDADNPDLERFRARGGKLIIHQGWLDPSVSPLDTIAHYRRIAQLSGGVAEASGFARLFLVPGLAHCSGGAGADRFDWISAIEDWVERGKAPDRLVGVQLRDRGAYLGTVDFPVAPAAIRFSRPAYPYPLQPRYRGRGDPDSSDSFVPYRAFDD